MDKQQEELIPTGGLIYFLCLEDILQNMPEESPILQYMLELDRETIEMGKSLYYFTLTQKKPLRQPFAS